ncbi:50S ribosomal protein L18a [Candidatus Micrarchaeota archaeon]|nr:50S ribosomal protein L18a [Candidatus Micrarchaeota archaeon]MBD3417698.1 50S ribosomal protein L18a [Candidatus Micrarchaeota archaeon]
MKFKVSGEIKVGPETRQFSKEIEAESEAHAREKTYALFGAQNGLKRVNVKIAEISKVA